MNRRMQQYKHVADAFCSQFSLTDSHCLDKNHVVTTATGQSPFNQKPERQ